MTIRGLVIFATFKLSAALAAECDCTTYPFRPNPPCYGRCVEVLSGSDGASVSSVKGIDPEVAQHIRTISKSPRRNAIDFERIRTIHDLEQAAVKSRGPGPSHSTSHRSSPARKAGR
jgi:hypothetical protein